jgi:hypothetical protein
MPSVINRAVSALRTEGVAQFDASDTEVSVPPQGPEGFPVRLEARGAREYLVQCDGWWQTFDRAEDAFDCFTFALCDQCRLQIVRRGRTPVEWQLQRREYGMWTPGRPVRRRWAPIWRRARVEHRRNQVFLSGTQSDASAGMPAVPPARAVQE